MIMILFLGLLASCDPGYTVYIANRSTSNIYIETDPSIESKAFLKSDSINNNSITSKKIRSSDVKNRYQLNSNQEIKLFGNVGFPSQNYFPYKSFKIIKGSDTIKIDKSNLIQKITKGKKSSYYININ